VDLVQFTLHGWYYCVSVVVQTKKINSCLRSYAWLSYVEHPTLTHSLTFVASSCSDSDSDSASATAALLL
jgi:hypothetical protein